MNKWIWLGWVAVVGCGGSANLLVSVDGGAADVGVRGVVADAGMDSRHDSSADTENADAGNVPSDAGADARRDAEHDAGEELAADAGLCATKDATPAWVTRSCPEAGCPAGTVCVESFGPFYNDMGCAPIPSSCDGTCSCMSCVCGGTMLGSGGCFPTDGGIACSTGLP